MKELSKPLLLVIILLSALAFSGCEAWKARKCGDCPKFKNKKRRSMIDSPVQVDQLATRTVIEEFA